MFATLRRFQASPAYTQLMGAIKQDLKQAMISKQKVEKNTIRSVLSTIKNSEIDGGKQTEFDLHKLFTKMVKQRDESEQMYLSQKRQDLAEVEAQESQIIRKYLDSLPVATAQEVGAKTETWLKALHGNDGGSLALKDVMKQVTEDLAKDWKTAPGTIRASIPSLYNQIWGAKN